MLVKSHTINENLLITVSSVGAYFVEKQMEGLMVIILYEIGKILEEKAVNNSRRSIKNLLDIKQNYANKKVNNELRNKLNYTGIIMTDDLAMDAVKEYVSNNTSATLAVNAGNDMIITSDFLTMKNEVLNSVEEGKIQEETIDKAVTRVIAWKYYSGLFDMNKED